MLKRPAVRFAFLGVALLGSATAFYVIAPLFVRGAPLYSFPTLAFMPTRTPLPPTETPLPTETATATPVQLSLATVVDVASAVIIAQGEFQSLAHSGQGTAYIYTDVSEQLVLVLDDFAVEDGPDLHVYLAVEAPPFEGEGASLQDPIDLGELKQIEGDQTYPISPDVPLEDYQSVVIWCVPYEIAFIGARLDAPSVLP